MKDKFELSLLESGEIMKRGTAALVNNIGRVVATITIIVSALVLFTDVKMTDLGSESFTTTLAVMMISSYLMYFSMTEAGENAGERCEKYKSALDKYNELCREVSGDKIAALRKFSQRYSADELRYRRESFLIGYGYGTDEYESYRRGEKQTKKATRVFRRADKFRAIALTPKSLLSSEQSKEKSELSNPGKFRFAFMVLRLLPTTVCMTVTVSVMLTTKDNLSIGVILDGIFKLSSLLLIGFKGYVSGYNYKKHKLKLWLETKTRLLDAFLKST